MRDELFEKCVDVAYNNLAEKEVLIKIRRAKPEMNRSHYYSRFKVDFASLNAAGTEPVNQRCIVIRIESHTGETSVDPDTRCEDIKDIDQT